jgi:hypothetical protein
MERSTLQDIRGNAAPGSVAVADFYAERFIKETGGSAKNKILEYMNEGLGFGRSFATDYEQNLEEFLVSEGMKSGETDFMGHTDPKGPFMVVAEFSFYRGRRNSSRRCGFRVSNRDHQHWQLGFPDDRCRIAADQNVVDRAMPVAAYHDQGGTESVSLS